VSKTTAGRLRHLMTECGLTNTALAEMSGVHANTVANWLSGRTPPSKLVLAHLDLLASIRRLGGR
jgi:transcriptional regulator with XRE-family HTH domain